MSHTISPCQLRYFLLILLKNQGVDDALIQPCSGRETLASLEVYSKLSLSNAQDTYDEKIKNFPV
jgi:integrase/recombinase XerD